MGYQIRVVPEVEVWLQAWYAEALIRYRTRYERDRGSTG